MKAFTNSSWIERPALGSAEDKVMLNPPRVGSSTFLQLPLPVFEERCRDHWRNGQRAATTFCLRLHELSRTVKSLELLGHANVPKPQVDVTPAKSEGFALTKAHCQRYRIQGFQTITPDRSQECACFGGGKGPNVVALHPGAVDHRR